MRGITLRLGSTGPDVKRLQLLLNSTRPSPRLALDGRFGSNTTDAVVRVQRAHGLSGDGVVGAPTWEILGQRGTATSPQSHAPVPQWMEVVALELGVHEDARPGYHNQRIVEYHKTTSLAASSDEVPWCSSFVNWALQQTNRRGTNSALAKSWLNWGVALTTARAGAITVIKRKGATSDAATGSTTGYHVAFYVSATPTHVRLLGGNQRDSVRYSNFALAGYSIEGFRWPTA